MAGHVTCERRAGTNDKKEREKQGKKTEVHTNTCTHKHTRTHTRAHIHSTYTHTPHTRHRSKGVGDADRRVSPKRQDVLDAFGPAPRAATSAQRQRDAAAHTQVPCFREDALDVRDGQVARQVQHDVDAARPLHARADAQPQRLVLHRAAPRATHTSSTAAACTHTVRGAPVATDTRR